MVIEARPAFRGAALALAVLLALPLLILAYSGAAFGLPALAGLPLLAAGLGLQLAGAVLAQTRLPAPRALEALRRGLLLAAPLLLLGLLACVPLLLWPLGRLLETGTLGAVLLFCAMAAIGGLIASRLFMLPVLLFLPEPPARRSLGQHLTRARAASGRLLERGQFDAGELFGGGLLSLLMLGPGVLAFSLSASQLREPAIAAALAACLLLLAPACALGLSRLTQAALSRAKEGETETPPAPSESVALTEAATQVAGDAASDPVSALFEAARRGDVDKALALLPGCESAEPEPPAGRDQRSLVQLAVLLPDTRLLRALILRGADLNAARGGLSPLLAATRDSYHGRPDAVAMLLANGADPRSTDGEGRTALHYAARNSGPEVAAQLLDAGAVLDALDRRGSSPLFEACSAGCWRLARFLLERGARCEPEAGQPVLLAAAAGEDDVVGVELLLRHKAKVDARGRLGRSALLEACLAGNAAIVSVLLKAGADAAQSDQQGVTALMEAARSGSVNTLAALRKKSPPLDAQDGGGRSALAIACTSARADAATVTCLLQMGADPHQACGSGQTPLALAVAAQRWDLVARLDPDHPLPLAMDEAPPMPVADGAAESEAAERIARALRRGRPDRLPELLRELSPSPALICELIEDFAGSQPRAALASLVWSLPVGGAHSREALLMRLLERAASAPAALDALLESGASAAGAGGLARYLRGCLDARLPGGADEARALYLLEAGADPFGGASSDEQRGENPLLLAVQLGWTRLLEALLARGVDPAVESASGADALLLAVQRRDAAAVRALIHAGARPDRRGADGQTALGLAISRGDSTLLRWLEWGRWPHPGRALRDADLITAASAGDALAVGCLLEVVRNPNVRDGRGCSALLRAAGAGHAEVVAVLLSAGLDPALPADSGMTALTAAISQGHEGVVELLLAGGAHVEQGLPGALRPLMLAAALGQARALELLIAAGADTAAVDAEGNSAVHHAARFGARCSDPARAQSLWQVLGAQRIAASEPNAMGESPLHLLLGAAEPAGTPFTESVLLPQLERLLEGGAGLDGQDGRGFSALHWAAQHGLLGAVQRLLRAGADAELRDSLARSPREVALTRGYVDIARELEGPKAPPSIARFLRSRTE